MNLEKRGSQWSKWDLHVHTPESIVHQYSAGSQDTWEAFISDLESLPEEFQVIGVNDYWFLGGYERLLAEKGKGRLANIRLFLPVVEIRLNQFGGTESKLSCVNYHVIFSDDIPAQVIREQFLHALTSEFNLSPRCCGAVGKSTWSGVVTRASLAELGKAVLNTVPEGELCNYGSALEEGFNNLTIPLTKVKDVLKSSFLRGKFVTAVGKTEWADIKWKDGSIADKKDIVNGANCVFTAAESIGSYKKAKVALENAGVNDRLLDCSDAHFFSGVSDKDRIGNSFTWVKADPTFAGLLQAIEEFEQRVFVGEEPAQLQRVREHPSKYIDRVRIMKAQDSSLSEHWFNTDLPLNSGLVAVIGNKGSGKSALAEVIGLLGGSPHEEHFSFLNDEKFRSPPRELASHFEGEIIWHQEEPRKALLSDRVSSVVESRVQHLPQRYLESLCNEVPTGEKTEFDRQLERIIFSHLPPEMKLKSDSLDEVIEIVTGAIDTELTEKRDVLKSINQNIATLEKQCEPEFKEKRKTAYVGLRREWKELRQNPPEEVPEPDASDPKLVRIREKIQELTKLEGHLSLLLQEKEERMSEMRRRKEGLESFRAKLEKLRREHKVLCQKYGELLRELELSNDISKFNINTERLNATESALSNGIQRLSIQINGKSEEEERGLRNALKVVKVERVNQRNELSAPEEAREVYLERLEEWRSRLHVLMGQRKSSNQDTVLGARNAYFELTKLPARLNDLRIRRRKLAKEIHGLLSLKAQKWGELYAPLQKHMDNEDLPEDYLLSVSTSLIDTGFSERFLNNMINRQVSGSFSGKDESDRLMEDLTRRVDFDDVESVLEFLETIDQHLRVNINSEERVKTFTSKQVRKGGNVADVYDWVYGQEYLSPRYCLLFGGKPIYQLSPGEKGTLLLIFFLLAEIDTRPLIIDQPEDNLDNNTVYRVLVRCFQRAKNRRQVIIVTHNPNLAVVCDADQIIVASMDKEDRNRIEYDPGAVERPTTTRAIVDILEGTHPAFQNRSVKYNMHIQDWLG